MHAVILTIVQMLSLEVFDMLPETLYSIKLRIIQEISISFYNIQNLTIVWNDHSSYFITPLSGQRNFPD